MTQPTYTAERERADLDFLIGARYARDAAVAKLPEILTKHGMDADWTCVCGEDLFGGSAAYSYELLRSHIASALSSAITEGLR